MKGKKVNAPPIASKVSFSRRTFCIFTKRWRHRIESCSHRFQNTRTLQKELGILCWRLLLVSLPESAGRTLHFKQIYKNVYLGGPAEQTDLQIKTCYFEKAYLITLCEYFRQWHLPSPFLLTFRKNWMDKPVFVLKSFFNCFTKTNKLEWENDIKLVGSQWL